MATWERRNRINNINQLNNVRKENIIKKKQIKYNGTNLTETYINSWPYMMKTINEAIYKRLIDSKRTIRGLPMNLYSHSATVFNNPNGRSFSNLFFMDTEWGI